MSLMSRGNNVQRLDLVATILVKSRWPLPPPLPGPLTMLALIPRSVFRLEITTLVGGAGERGSGGAGEGMFNAKCPNYFGRDCRLCALFKNRVLLLLEYIMNGHWDFWGKRV